MSTQDLLEIPQPIDSAAQAGGVETYIETAIPPR
jgi:hypothetical protein